MTNILRMMLPGAVLALALHGAAVQTRAATLPAPQGRVILKLSGAVTEPNAGDRVELDLATLEAVGTAKFETSTAWTDGRPSFEGVLLRDLLKATGAKGQTVTAVALNDYKVTIPVSDLEKYPVMLAYKMNGELLKIRDKGPLWIVYPQDDYPELKTKAVQSKWVWQVKELRVD